VNATSFIDYAHYLVKHARLFTLILVIFICSHLMNSFQIVSLETWKLYGDGIWRALCNSVDGIVFNLLRINI